MKLGSKGAALIKSFEQLKLRSYPDERGVWTIGWGHTGFYQPGLPIGPNQIATPQRADMWLVDDTGIAVRGVNGLVTQSLNQNQFDALVSFTYNVGVGALAHSTLLRELNAGNFSGAAEQFLRWDYAGDKESAGLERRRRAERDLFLTAVGD